VAGGADCKKFSGGGVVSVKPDCQTFPLDCITLVFKYEFDGLSTGCGSWRKMREEKPLDKYIHHACDQGMEIWAVFGLSGNTRRT